MKKGIERFEINNFKNLSRFAAVLGATALTLSGCGEPTEKTAIVQASCTDGSEPVLEYVGDPVVVKCRTGEIKVSTEESGYGEDGPVLVSGSEDTSKIVVEWKALNPDVARYGVVVETDPKDDSRVFIDPVINPRDVDARIIPQEK